MDPNTLFFLGTERTTTKKLVPFRSVPQGRIVKTRPDIYLRLYQEPDEIPTIQFFQLTFSVLE